MLNIHGKYKNTGYCCCVIMNRKSGVCFASSSFRTLLRLSGGTQDPDEDGPQHGPGRSRQLHAGSAGARRGAETHQPPQAGPGHGVRHLQRVRHHLRPRGEQADHDLTRRQSVWTVTCEVKGPFRGFVLPSHSCRDTRLACTLSRRSFAVDELSFVSRRLCSQGVVVGILAIVLSKNKRSRCLVGIAGKLSRCH